MRRLVSETDANTHTYEFALLLVNLGRILDELDDMPKFKTHIEMKINEVLQECVSRGTWGGRYLFSVGLLLDGGEIGNLDVDTGVRASRDVKAGNLIVSKFKQFKVVRTIAWNMEVPQKSPEDTVQEIKSYKVLRSDGAGGSAVPTGEAQTTEAPIERDLLTKGFEEYSKVWGTHFNAWKSKEMGKDGIAREVMEAASQLPQCGTDIRNSFPMEVREAIPTLLGGIFAYFTIARSGKDYLDLLGKDGEDNISELSPILDGHPIRKFTAKHALLIPHNVQVISVLRMFGYDDRSSLGLQNQLMQIRTGEGKSIILGACSTLLALLGFPVRCVCYSNYLSERDFKDFEDVFDAFGVSDRVVYSKIIDYSEACINAKGDIRTLTECLFRDGMRAPGSGGQDLLPTRKKGSTRHDYVAREEVLLVDAVDVFFGKDFYGRTYSTTTTVAEPEVRALLEKVWELRGITTSNIGHLLRMMRDSEEFVRLVARFPNWEDFLVSELSQMVADMRNFNEPKHYYAIERDDANPPEPCIG